MMSTAGLGSKAAGGNPSIPRLEGTMPPSIEEGQEPPHDSVLPT